MIGRAALRWAPWVLLGAIGALVGLVSALAMNGTLLSDTIGLLAGTSAFALVGTLLAVRRPRNPMGWLCLGFALVGVSQVAAQAYATHGLIVDFGSLPGATFAAWWSGWTGTPSIFFFMMLLPLLFPTGRPPSRRWRPVLWLVLATMVVSTLVSAFSPGPLAGAPEFVNPVGLGVGEVPAPAGAVFGAAYIGAFITSLLLCAASLVARYRQSRGPERQQLKWFVYAYLLVIGLFVVGATTGDYGVWWSVVFPATVMTIPIAIGIAVLRYRLYDIDLIINRTLVYGVLTAILAAAYVGAIAVLQVGLQPFTQGSQLAVAASTLVVAALFQPLRARIQRVVDRRFYRSRYDAERTVDRFAGRLRDELDLAALSAELIDVVGETVRPARAGIWLRRVRA